MSMSLSAVLTVAAKEFKDCCRNKWLLTGSVLFALLTLAIVYGGAATGGELVFRPLQQVMNSLVSLTVFLLPLVVILISSEAFVGEKERGTLLLMLTYPISRTDWLAGKLIGQSCALLLILILGFAVLPVLDCAGFLGYGLADLLASLSELIGTAWILGVIFILLSFAVSLLVESKAQALAFLLLVWLLCVLLYDLGLLVFAIVAEQSFKAEVLSLLVAANPASAFRLLNQVFLGIEKTTLAVPAVFAVLFGWIVALYLICAVLLRTRKV